MHKIKDAESVKDVPPVDNNLLIVSVGYNNFVFPYDVGYELIKAFRQAEMVDIGYSDKIEKVFPIPLETLKFRFLSEYAYKQRKMELLIEGN